MKPRRLLSFLLVIAMMFSVFSVVASASGGDNEQAESFLGSNKLRIAGKIDLFGLDIIVGNDYNATITAYKGYDGFSSEEVAGIRIATNIESIGNVDKTIDVGNVGINAIREKLQGTQVPEETVTYDLVYNLIDAVLSNLAKQTFTVTYGEKTSTYTIAQVKYDGYQTLTMTADTVDFGEEWAALFGTEAGKTIQMSYDADAEEKVSVKLAQDSYVRLGNQKRTLKADTEVNALDSTDEVDLANIAAVLMGDIENTETFAFNDKKAVLELKEGTELTVGKTTVKLNNNVRLTVDGLGIEDNLISKIERITAGLGDVTLADYTGLTNIIPDKAGTIAITAEVEPQEETFNAQAFIFRGGELVGQGDLSAIWSSNSLAQAGDVIVLNNQYNNGTIQWTLTSQFGATGPNNLTLDLNGATFEGTSATNFISAKANSTLKIINSSETPATIKNTKNSTSAITLYVLGTLEFGREEDGNVGAINVLNERGSLAIKSYNTAAHANIYAGNFSGDISQAKGEIKISGGTFDHDPTAYVADDYKAVDNDNNTWTVVPKVYVAQIGSTKYETLVAAVAAANADTSDDEITIELLADLDFSEEVYAGYKWAGSTYNPLAITRSNVTIDLGGHTISNMGNVAIVFGNMLAVNGRFANGTIQNGTLLAGKTDNVTNSYVLGIAGMDGMTIKNVTTNGGINVYTESKDVVIDSCNVNGTKYYTVCAQSGSDVTIKGTTYTKNTDGTVANKAMFWVAKAGKDSDVITDANPTGAFEASSITIESGDFTVDFNNGGSFWLTSYLKPVVKGGTFNFNPTAYVAEGYEAVALTGENEGLWKVGKVEFSPVVEVEPVNDSFDTAYTVTKSVVDTNNELNEVAPTLTVNVKVVTDEPVSVDPTPAETTAIASEHNAEEIISKLDMQEVLTAVVAAVDSTADSIDVSVQLVRDETEVDTVNNTITYEVHPEAVVFVNNVATKTVAISNDALAENAKFTIKLPVPDDIAEVNGYVKVTHYSVDMPAEINAYKVQGDATNGYYVQFDVTHFSDFTVEPNTGLFNGYSISLNGYIDLNFFLNVADDQVNNGYGVDVTFTWDDKEVVYHVVTGDKVVGKGYKATVQVPAAEMTYDITASVKINNVLQSSQATYSVHQYALDLLAVSTDTKEINLVKAMLEFGARAQLAFGINTDNLANAGTGYDMPNTPQYQLVEDINAAIYNANHEYASNMYEVANDLGVEYYSSSLTYLSGCKLRLYFRGYGLTGFDDVKNDYYYFVEAANIPAADLDTLQVFHVGEHTFKYSALDFVRAIIMNYHEDDSFYKLAEATYYYNQAANTYFAHHSNS